VKKSRTILRLEPLDGDPASYSLRLATSHYAFSLKRSVTNRSIHNFYELAAILKVLVTCTFTVGNLMLSGYYFFIVAVFFVAVLLFVTPAIFFAAHRPGMESFVAPSCLMSLSLLLSIMFVYQLYI
jgi:hypothetical protein